jgi:transcription-repair coupling factor (superfamily II helicase)
MNGDDSTKSSSNPTYIVVVPIRSVITKVLPKEHLSKLKIEIVRGNEIEIDSIVNFLIMSGYTYQDVVKNPGDYSIRGGILDFYGPSKLSPVRLEFFGNVVESIRTFEPETQRSINEIRTIEVLPASELVLTEENKKRGISWIRETGAKVDTPVPRVRKMIEEIEGFRVPPGLGAQAPAFYGEMNTLFDYLPNDALIFIEEPDGVFSEAFEFHNLSLNNYNRSIEKKDPSLPVDNLFISPDEIKNHFTETGIIKLNPIVTEETDKTIRVDIVDHSSLRSKIKGIKKGDALLAPLAKKITHETNEGNRVAIVCLTKNQGKRLSDLLNNHNVEMVLHDLTFNAWLRGHVKGAILVGGLSNGFEDPSQGLVVITEEEIFGAKVKIRKAKPSGLGETITQSDPLSPGDYVVHNRFGVGKYIGLLNLKVMDVTGDFLHIEYEDDDKLYIPVDKISLLHRYRGGNSDLLKLDKLGSGVWEKSKAKVKTKIMEMAKELAALYAKRKANPGYSFTSPENDFAAFEAEFAFEETPDQLKATEELIADLISPTPMDRLISGDVGYGKTEVAMRAAFIAVMEGKQVSVIVPTTILAEQHYLTFKERFSNYPVNVKMLSRFLTKNQQGEVISGLKDGTVDIVIGTHRLLSKDISFLDLGLLIVDEEHRFGVTHKEKIIKIKTQLDVLAMTATPIPRTLSMSLMGIRDISVINTPPLNRLSIKTYVLEFDPDVIKEAVLREINRGGQIFFVHNRVKSIPAMHGYLEELLPEVKIGVAHGQMNENELEKVMLDFINKRIDLLLSSAIIESGIDIPSANTMIINRADMFGLAQLYQIRGRVGRSSVRAYTYLLVPGTKGLTQNAEKRLKVISEFTELGSGMKIAMHDLEIRGAGNLLGKDQSGHINAVGFEMYNQMVKEAITSIKGEAPTIEFDPEITIPISTFIPDSYIPDSTVRLSLYRKLINAKDETRLKEITDEIKDRFGKPPQEVANLIDLTEIRFLARKAGIISVKYQGGCISTTFHKKTLVDTGEIVALVNREPERYGVSPDGALKITPTTVEIEGLLNSLKILLQNLAQYVIF